MAKKVKGEADSKWYLMYSYANSFGGIGFTVDHGKALLKAATRKGAAVEAKEKWKEIKKEWPKNKKFYLRLICEIPFHPK